MYRTDRFDRPIRLNAPTDPTFANEEEKGPEQGGFADKVETFRLKCEKAIQFVDEVGSWTIATSFLVYALFVLETLSQADLKEVPVVFTPNFQPIRELPRVHTTRFRQLNVSSTEYKIEIRCS